MAARQRKPDDKQVERIRQILESGYRPFHPRARIDVKRYNSVSVRVRVIDPDFSGKSPAKRDDWVWEVLDTLPEETRAEISLLVLLTPAEAKTAIMNVEFDRPTPSRL